MGIDQDPPACSHIQENDVTAERQPFVVGTVFKSCGLGRGTIRYDNVNASTRALGRSTTLDDLQLGKKGPRHEFVPRSTAASTVSDVLAHAADPTDGAGGYSQGDHSKKTTNEFTSQGDSRDMY